MVAAATSLQPLETSLMYPRQLQVVNTVENAIQDAPKTKDGEFLQLTTDQYLAVKGALKRGDEASVADEGNNKEFALRGTHRVYYRDSEPAAPRFPVDILPGPDVRGNEVHPKTGRRLKYTPHVGALVSNAAGAKDQAFADIKETIATSLRDDNQTMDRTYVEQFQAMAKGFQVLDNLFWGSTHEYSIASSKEKGLPIRRPWLAE